MVLLVIWASLGAETFSYFEEAEAHRATASQLWTVRESYIPLITDLVSGDISGVDVQVRRGELQEEVYTIYSVALRTSGRAFKRVQDGLKNNEKMTFDPREIDLFLPEALRFNDDKD